MAAFTGIIYLNACHSAPQQQDNDTVTLTKMPPATTTDAFNNRMDTVLQVYYRLKDAFFAADTGMANETAGLLKSAIDSLPLNLVAADSLKYNKARIAVESLKGEIAGLEGENTIKNKQLEFGMISDILYDLVKAVGLKNQTVYRQFCPMAFNNKGGYWLSDKEEIRNPYYGKKMPDCGEVKEALKF